MKFFQVKSAIETIELIDKYVNHIEDQEMVPIMQANGRIAAENLNATEHTPAFMRSSVDGYAVIAADTFGSSESMPGFLTVTGSVKMGEAATGTLQFGEAVYVPTGGMIPEGADAMVMIEHCELNTNLLSVYKQVAPLENVIQVGEDYREGDLIIKRGTRLRAQELGALATQGYAEVAVYRKPFIAYLSTGDEVTSYEEHSLPMGKVRDMNAVTIAATAEDLGAEFMYGGIIPDKEEDLEAACRHWLEKADCLILSGGSSVGAKDYSVEIIERLGNPGVYVHGISVKPGKPTILASANGKPVIGLPGHPASALIIFMIFGAEVIKRLSGASDNQTTEVLAKSEKRIASSVGRTDYIRVELEQIGTNFYAKPVLGKSSLISTLVKSDGLLVIPAAKEGIEKNEVVSVLLLK